MQITTIILCTIVLISTGLPLINSAASDHFPLLIGLNYEPDDDNIEGLENTNAGVEAEVEEKIEDGKKESAVK